MARKLLAGVVAGFALGAVAAAGASQLPNLRSARVVDRHVAVQVAVGDMRLSQLTVATRPTVDGYGALMSKNVRLRETIQLAPSTTGVVSWRSTKTLAPGTYFVQVVAFDNGEGGITDCPPKLRNCLVHWSNVRRVVVPSG
ncbi:MAG TPA: hypothetical protein VF094_04040 [Gaiellaceae bacterium]